MKYALTIRTEEPIQNCMDCPLSYWRPEEGLGTIESTWRCIWVNKPINRISMPNLLKNDCPLRVAEEEEEE